MLIDRRDCVDGMLPKTSVVKMTKVFTIHSSRTIQRIDAPRRASGEAAKWEREFAEMKQNLLAVPQQWDKLVESTAEPGSQRP